MLVALVTEFPRFGTTLRRGKYVRLCFLDQATQLRKKNVFCFVRMFISHFACGSVFGVIVFRHIPTPRLTQKVVAMFSATFLSASAF